MLSHKLIRKFNGLIMSLVIGAFIFAPLKFVYAIQIIPGCAISGDGGVCCAIFLISNLTKWILGVSGIGALIFFIYGGFLWITSAGSSEKVKQGVKIMTSTIIGLIVVAMAWTIINFTIQSMVDVPNGNNTNKWTGVNDNWYSMCKDYDACGSKGSDWQCTKLPACGISDYTQCDAAQNCERFLCSGGNDRVCCNPNIKTGLENK